MPPPSIANLHDPGCFRLLARIEYADLLPFVQEYYLTRRSGLVWGHYLLSLVCVAGLAWVGIAAGVRYNAWMQALGLGFLGFLVLIPIHEGIHALVYWLLGARDIRFGVSVRMMAFYAVAHHYVVGARGFVWLALAPFLAINGILLVLALVSPELRLFALILSLLHLSAVSGDWALLNFFWVHRGAAVYTYDDANARTSYFYYKECQP